MRIVTERTRPTNEHACRCGKTWTGANTSHCSASGCHKTFTSVSSFDRHRHNGHCLDPDTARSDDGATPMFELNDKGWYGTYQSPEARAKLKAYFNGRRAATSEMSDAELEGFDLLL